jgi:hypothetical protein
LSSELIRQLLFFLKNLLTVYDYCYYTYFEKVSPNKIISMRALAGILSFLAIVLIAVIMIIQEQIKIRKNKLK